MNENYCFILEKTLIYSGDEKEYAYKFIKTCCYSKEEEDKFLYEKEEVFNIKYYKQKNSKYYFVPMPLEELFGNSIKDEDSEDVLAKADELFTNQYFEIIEKEEGNFGISLIEKMTIKDVYEEIIDIIKGQDEQVKSVLSSIIWNQRLNASDLSLNEIAKNKHNILIMGPTGTGKTEIIRQISENLGLPMVVVDATEYTRAGYVGKSVEDMLINLYNNADGNLELAQNSILVIDEFDKLSRWSEQESTVNSTGVQRALLTLIEGSKKEIELERKTIEFDTRGLTIILLGAFSGLYQQSNINNRTPGFNIDKNFKEKQTVKDENLVEKLSKYGIENEIIGRINRIIELNKMTKEILLEILKSPGGRLMSILKIFEAQGVTFEIDDDYLEEIAEIALKDNKGVRSLNRIIDDIISRDFNAVMFGEKDNIVIGNKKDVKIRKKEI